MNGSQQYPPSLLKRPETQWRVQPSLSINKAQPVAPSVIPGTVPAVSQLYEEREVLYLSQVRDPVDPQASCSVSSIYETPINRLKSQMESQEKSQPSNKQKKQSSQQQQPSKPLQPSPKKEEKIEDTKDKDVKSKPTLSPLGLTLCTMFNSKPKNSEKTPVQNKIPPKDNQKKL